MILSSSALNMTLKLEQMGKWTELFDADISMQTIVT